MPFFTDYISVDWSGQGRDERTSRYIGVVERKSKGRWKLAKIPKPRKGQIHWSRRKLFEYVVDRFSLNPTHRRILLMLDFGFGYPYGADREIFAANGWHSMITRLSDCYFRCDSDTPGRTAAQKTNARLPHSGPFRFEDRKFDFYTEHGIPYYRLTENFVPEAKSQFLLDPRIRGIVGIHTITGLSWLSTLLQFRECHSVRLDFRVWPHEWRGGSVPKGCHVIAEGYPKIYPIVRHPRSSSLTDDQRDALRMLNWAYRCDKQGDLLNCLNEIGSKHLSEKTQSRIKFEGWILGVPLPRLGAK